jgi:class 3 adenylate cyclase/tetratricopeptide (TPR) repeat protein
MPSSAPKESTSGRSGWRGYVTVLFSDVCGYTALNEASDPEDVDLMRQKLEELATVVINKHGGEVTQCYGDGILAVFGFPTPKEDDSRRAIDAAIDLHDAIRGADWGGMVDPGFEMRLHTGVNAGLVFAREGDALHGAYDMTGDSVNTAARLCSAASRDEILVSLATLRGIEAFFVTDPGVELTLKGKSLPVPAHRVTGRSMVRTSFEARSLRGLTQFVGRDGELAALSTLLGDASRERRSRIGVVSGAAGIGKSRLLEAHCATALAADMPVLFGCCESYGELGPLGPFIQALRHWAGIKGSTSVDEAIVALREKLEACGGEVLSHLSTLLQLLSLQPSPPPTNEVAAAEPLAMRALMALFRRLTETSPVLLVLDDWQWADDMSKKAFDAIVGDAQGRALCVVLGVRSPEPTAALFEDARSIHLAPFDEDECALVARTLRPQDLDVGVARAIHRRSGGNPLFVEELCRSLPAEPLGGDQVLEQQHVPTTLQGVIQNRVAALPPAEATTLRAASVFGTEFSVSLLAEVVGVGVEPLQSILDALARGDLIYATERAVTFRFKHGVTRDVIYESVRILERRHLHQAIAVAIARGVESGKLADQSEALAYHHRGSGDRERSAFYAELAGNKAVAASALDHARLQYESALEALDKLPPTVDIKRRWLGVALSWAGACVYSPERSHLQIVERAAKYARELGDVAREAEAEYWVGWIDYVLGDHVEANAHYQKAILLAEVPGGERLIAQLWGNVGQNDAAAGNYAAALPNLARCIDSKRARGPYTSTDPVPQGLAYALAVRAMIEGAVGDFAAAEASFEEADSLSRGRQHAIEGSVCAIQAVIEFYRGRWDVCAGAAARSMRISRRFSGVYVFAMSSVFGAYSRFMTTGAPEAVAEMRTSVHWLESRGVQGFGSLSYAALADALVTVGHHDDARLFAERALDRAAHGDPLGESMAYRVLARLHHERGEHQPCVDALKEAARAADARGSERDLALTRLLSAELVAPESDDERQAQLEAAERDFERMSMPWHTEKTRTLLRALPTT